MKLFSAEQIKRIDAATIQNEPISSIDLMERAAEMCVDWLMDQFDLYTEFHVYCGMGNNGGDGLAISRLLVENGYTVYPIIIEHREKGTEEFEINRNRLQEMGIEVKLWDTETKLFPTDEYTVAIDALLGIGLEKPLSGDLLDAVHHISTAYWDVVSVDVPSGLPSDLAEVEWNYAVEATYTLTFQFPKLSFLLPQTGIFTGQVQVMDIGLSEEAILNEATPFHLTIDEDVENIRDVRNPFSHKGHFGHALLVGGHSGMMGAAVLATKSALRSGAGLVTTHVPAEGRDILQISAPEAMVQLDHNADSISNISVGSKITAIGIGMGMGRENSVFRALENFLPQADIPLVLDADALHLLGTSQAIDLIPKWSILTPHRREFERLLGRNVESDNEILQEAIQWAVQHQCILVLKGAHTAVCAPSGDVYFNSTGHPAMASGGTGDVLTGLITGILAQGIEPLDAAKLGVWLHGCAGENAAAKRGEHAVKAGDLIEELF